MIRKTNHNEKAERGWLAVAGTLLGCQIVLWVSTAIANPPKVWGPFLSLLAPILGGGACIIIALFRRRRRHSWLWAGTAFALVGLTWWLFVGQGN